jgi:hypothetical protein
MKHARLFVALTAFSAFAMAGLAAAQSAPASPMPAGQAAADQGDKPTPTFDALDAKHRGYLQRSDLPKDIQALAKLRAHFTEADVNHDGHISRDEYDAYVIPSDKGMVRGDSPRPGVMGGGAGSVGSVSGSSNGQR